MPKNPPRARGRAPTLAAIIAAARKEFALKGYAGARMESIARTAGINKELIYHYFRSKEHIFQEVRGQHRTDVLTDDARLDLAVDANGPAEDLFAWRFDTAMKHMEWVKLLTWEAAQDEGAKVPCEESRREGTRRTIDTLREAQNDGRISDEFDPHLLQLAVFALATYPLAFGQITRMATGKSPSDPQFQKEWRAFLEKLGKKVLPPPAAAAAPAKPASPRARKRAAKAPPSR